MKFFSDRRDYTATPKGLSGKILVVNGMDHNEESNEDLLRTDLRQHQKRTVGG
jgi:hypothetical protein